MNMPNFSNLQELSDYLQKQEQRIQALEKANAELISEVKKRFVHKDDLASAIDFFLPKTGFFSRNLLVRSFSAWGHTLIAQLIVSVILGAIYGLVFLLILAKLS